MKTIQEIYNGDLYQSIQEFLGQVKFPEAPVKPRSPQKGTSSDYAEYAKELAFYEESMIHYRRERDESTSILYSLEDELRLFLIEISGWKDHPKADKAWSYAWQEGHSSGYYKVFSILCELYDYFA